MDIGHWRFMSQTTKKRNRTKNKKCFRNRSFTIGGWNTLGTKMIFFFYFPWIEIDLLWYVDLGIGQQTAKQTHKWISHEEWAKTIESKTFFKLDIWIELLSKQNNNKNSQKKPSERLQTKTKKYFNSIIVTFVATNGFLK